MVMTIDHWSVELC